MMHNCLGKKHINFQIIFIQVKYNKQYNNIKYSENIHHNGFLVFRLYFFHKRQKKQKNEMTRKIGKLYFNVVYKCSTMCCTRNVCKWVFYEIVTKYGKRKQ